jgi:hypothetical protein
MSEIASMPWPPKPMFRPEKLPCDIGTPSMTYSGSLPPEIDDEPRTRTVMAAPGVPEFCTTCTPASRPCSTWFTDVTGISSTVSGRSDETAPAMSPRRCSP